MSIVKKKKKQLLINKIYSKDGDGVEEAFYLTNRVLTLSFHQYGDDFFPGSGSLESCGFGEGKYHSINGSF